MKANALSISLTFLLICLLQVQLFSSDREEHRRIAQQALEAVLKEHRADLHTFLLDFFVRNDSLLVDRALSPDKSFGELSTHDSGNDISLARCHENGKTILQQLQSCPSTLVDEVWQTRKSGANILSAEQSDKNVIVNYLLHHLIALRFANRAGLESRKEDLRVGLVYEAMAVGYLTDAFSSSHMMLPLRKFLAGLQGRNFRIAHNTHGRKGLYVVNSTGDAWQTFGDDLMEWYGPTYRHVLEAAVTSLREFLQVFDSAVDSDARPVFLQSGADSAAGAKMVASWLKTHAGAAYYERLKLPTLLLLPMPVSATWSKKDTEVDTLGIHARFHFPQLKEPGFHDPSLDKRSVDFLPSEAASPKWLIPAFLDSYSTDTTAAELVRDDSTIASVRFTQDKNVPPSFRGLLLHAATGFSLQQGNDIDLMFGVGYSPLDDLLLLNNLSFDLFYRQTFSDVERQMLTATVGAGLKLPKSLKIIDAIRVEGGYALGLNSGLNKLGYKLTAGLEFPVLALGFTYAGLTPRLMFQRVDVGPNLDGMYVQFIFH